MRVRECNRNVRQAVLIPIPLDSDGYDDAGCYWGAGQPLYLASGEDGGEDVAFRAKTRGKAMREAQRQFPKARVVFDSMDSDEEE